MLYATVTYSKFPGLYAGSDNALHIGTLSHVFSPLSTSLYPHCHAVCGLAAVSCRLGLGIEDRLDLYPAHPTCAGSKAFYLACSPTRNTLRYVSYPIRCSIHTNVRYSLLIRADIPANGETMNDPDDAGRGELQTR